MKGTVKKWGINGEGVLFPRRKAVFVQGAIPGETIEYEITADHPHYAGGKLTRVTEPSPRRRHPLCPKWEECGGCSLMHLDYKGQVRMKEQVLKDTLRKYAGYTGPIEPLLKNPDPLGYRNACKMPFGLDEEGRPSTGMYQRGSREFVPIERCVVHSRKLETVRNRISELARKLNLPVVRNAQKPGYMNLVLKEYNGKVHVILVTSDLEVDPKLVEGIMNLDNVASLWQSVKTQNDPAHELFGQTIRHLAGEETMHLDLDGLDLQLLPRSFFQLNTAQAKNIYDLAVSWLPDHVPFMVEAYAGVGAISLKAADKADRIVGIESIQDAVDNANENAASNHKDNVSFVCGDAATELKKILETETPQVLVADPPRTGLDQSMKDALKKTGIETMIYISCNPSTLAKDIEDLKPEYEVKRVKPVDMFSQTPNIETAVLLTRKNQTAESEQASWPE